MNFGSCSIRAWLAQTSISKFSMGNSTVNEAALLGCRSYTFGFYKSPVPPIHYHNGKYKRQQIRSGLKQVYSGFSVQGWEDV